MSFTMEPMRKIIKKAGAKRVSDNAAKELSLIMEQKTKDLLVQADRLSKHAGRRTVMRRDVKMARKVIEK